MNKEQALLFILRHPNEYKKAKELASIYAFDPSPENAGLMRQAWGSLKEMYMKEQEEHAAKGWHEYLGVSVS